MGKIRLPHEVLVFPNLMSGKPEDIRQFNNKASEFMTALMRNFDTLSENITLDYSVLDGIDTVNSSSFTETNTNRYIKVNYTTTGAVTITITAAAIAVEKALWVIKDTGGNAGTNNITINNTVDGSSPFIIDCDNGSATLWTDGSNLFVA